MKRQYPSSVTNTALPPSLSGKLASDWSNEQIFERWGDDNTVYFSDVSDQTALQGGWIGSAPLGPMGTFGHLGPFGASEERGDFSKDSIISVPSNHSATTFLCEESENVKRTILLQAGASVKIYLDAWEHYQTVPLIVQAASSPYTRVSVPYEWEFFNYVPIGQSGGGSSGGNSRGRGKTQLSAEGINYAPPIIQTLGHTNRAPNGEFPPSRETKEKKCCCAAERPYLVFRNVAPYSSLSSHSGGGDMLLVVKIAQ